MSDRIFVVIIYMDTSSLGKIFVTAKRLGVPAIVLFADEPVVVMSVTDYERLAGNRGVEQPVVADTTPAPAEQSWKSLSEEELFDKINREISAWRSAHAEAELEKTAEVLPANDPILAPVPTRETSVARDGDDEFYIEPVG